MSLYLRRTSISWDEHNPANQAIDIREMSFAGYAKDSAVNILCGIATSDLVHFLGLLSCFG